jgi:hypothetical protein
LNKLAKKSKKKTKPKEIKTWRQAMTFDLRRTSPIAFEAETLERGVNFFVLMLEKLGAYTCFSCEGHPNSFYLTFVAPINLAVRIRSCGFFTVELEGHNYWSIRINRDVTEQTRVSILTYAAEAWAKEFGPITYVKDVYVNRSRNQKRS